MAASEILTRFVVTKEGQICSGVWRIYRHKDNIYLHPSNTGRDAKFSLHDGVNGRRYRFSESKTRTPARTHPRRARAQARVRVRGPARWCEIAPSLASQLAVRGLRPKLSNVGPALLGQPCRYRLVVEPDVFHAPASELRVFREPIVRRLSAGESWIRTVGS